MNINFNRGLHVLRPKFANIVNDRECFGNILWMWMLKITLKCNHSLSFQLFLFILNDKFIILIVWSDYEFKLCVCFSKMGGANPTGFQSFISARNCVLFFFRCSSAVCTNIAEIIRLSYQSVIYYYYYLSFWAHTHTKKKSNLIMFTAAEPRQNLLSSTSSQYQWWRLSCNKKKKATDK